MIDWLTKLKKLRVDRSKGTPAPHKPLLLLAVLDLIEEGTIQNGKVFLTPELAFRFLSYWEIVSNRVKRLGRVELPFFHLQGDGVWTLISIPGYESVLDVIRPTSVEQLNRVISHAEINIDLVKLLENKEGITRVRRTILQRNYFVSNELAELANIFDIENIEADKESVILKEPQVDFSVKRDVKFRLKLIPLYKFTCALCKLRTVMSDGRTIVDAAHIHSFSDSRNNDIRNGIALCKNHHWAFDQGLWTVKDDGSIIISKTSFIEDGEKTFLLCSYDGCLLHIDHVPIQLRPEIRHFNWHRDNIFIR